MKLPIRAVHGSFVLGLAVAFAACAFEEHTSTRASRIEEGFGPDGGTGSGSGSDAGTTGGSDSGTGGGSGSTDGGSGSGDGGVVFGQGPGQPPPGGAPGPQAPPCKMTADQNGNPVASSMAPNINVVHQAMSAWVGTQCGAGFHATPRDVTCRFKTKIEDPKAGPGIKVVGTDWRVPENGEYLRPIGGRKDYFDNNGQVVASKPLGGEDPPTETEFGTFRCKLDCTGKLSSTIGTADVIDGDALGIPPGFLPPQNEATPGRSFCQAYQNALRGANADCSVADARTSWTASLGDTQKTPWKKTDEMRETSSTSSLSPGEQALYPTAVKAVYTYQNEVWVVVPADMQNTCNALRAAHTQEDLDLVCKNAAYVQSFSSVSPAQICIPNGPGDNQ